MRRLMAGVCAMILFAAAGDWLWAQRNPRDTAKMDLNGKTVSVEYGRPSLKGRTAEQMFDQLPAGEVWRLGADQSTTFSTPIDLKVGDVAVPKGEYSLWARKEADKSWTLVFNKQHGQWGTDHDPTQDLYAVPLKQAKAANSQEALLLKLAKEGNGGVFTIHWGDLQLTADLQAK